MNSSRKVMGIIAAAVVIAIVGIVWAWHPWGGVGTAPAGPVAGSGPSSATSSSLTRGPVPAGATAPDQGATAVAAGVAVPAIQSVGDPSGNVEYRSFNITAENGAFSPSTVIVNQGDTVNLEITAIGANYSFTQPDYGFDTAITKGKTKTIQFQALESGDFVFYCGSCGGPSKGPVGHLIVTASS